MLGLCLQPKTYPVLPNNLPKKGTAYQNKMNKFFRKSLIVSLALIGGAFGQASAWAQESPSTSRATIAQQKIVAVKSKSDQVKESSKKPEVVSKYRHLKPFYDNAPALTEVVKVRFTTSAGNIEMEIYPQAAPNAAGRFIELVKAGYYDNTPIFRVVNTPRPFVAQFGINWRDGQRQWNEKKFNDDPSLFHLEDGTLAFAKAGPNTNSTQVFINYGNNDFLREQTFSTFGIITKGLEIAHNFKQVGDPSMGLSQKMLSTNGDAYLKQLPANQQPTMIIKAEIIQD